MRWLTSPARRLLDPRFRGVSEQIDARHHALLHEIRANRDEALRLNHERASELALIAARLDSLESRLLDRQPDAHVDTLLTAGRVLGLIERQLEDVHRAVLELRSPHSAPEPWTADTMLDAGKHPR
jgi:hypothetical protein